MIRRPPRSTQSRSSAASDVYKRQVHEECLAGMAAWGATNYPVPLSWGASFHPELIEQMAHHIGESMRSVGVHQGLAPVLDVVRAVSYTHLRAHETRHDLV